MTDLLKTGSDWLQGQRSRHLTHAITYRRGDQSVPLTATVDETTFEVDDGSGIVERFETRDFLISAVDLALGVLAATPQLGDRIDEMIDGREITYGVLAPPGEPAWRYEDPFRRTIRIHTKQLETQT